MRSDSVCPCWKRTRKKERRDTDRPIPEAFDDETPDEGPVPGDRDRGEAAFLLEVVGILASKRRQRGLIDLRLW